MTATAGPRQYFLCSHRVGFSTWTAEEDVELAVGLWGDAAVTSLIGGPFDLTAVKARLLREIDHQHKYGVQYWPLFDLGTGQFVGCCGLRPYQSESTAEVLELGVHLRADCWGSGYATEVARKAIEYAFKHLKVARLFAGHHPQNDPSRGLLLKLGFQFARDEFYAPTGLMHPSYFLHNDHSTSQLN